MITIFDLDYTLLDSIAVKEKLTSVLGMSKEEYNKSYKENFKDKKENYTLEKHLAILRENGYFDSDIKVQAVKNKFKDKMKELDDFLFDGAVELILSEKAKGNRVVLLTFGNISWQKEKVARLSTIKNLFDEIHYEDKDKAESEYLDELNLGDEEFTIINDNILETEKMLKILGDKKCEVVIVNGPYSDKETAKKFGFNYSETIKDVFPDQETENKEFRIAGLK